MEERLRFIDDWHGGEWTMAELCRFYGISRKTGYKWVNRYEAGGLEGLQDRSRARHQQDHAVSPHVCEAIIAARRRHPTWGPKKLGPWLAKVDPDLQLPSRTTMATILRQAGLVRPPRRGRRLIGGQGGLGGEDAPNAVWAADFKGQFRLGNRQYCYPLTVSDLYSRYVLECRGLPGTRWEPVQRVFRRLFNAYGLPQRIRTDNGVPFASTGLGRLSHLAVWWIDLGIQLQRIKPGTPCENGCHERMHLTLKKETASPPAPSGPSQQRRFNRFRCCFNEERPHEALGQTCPASHYRPSARTYEGCPGPAEYPGHYAVRSVRTDGSIKWNGQWIFVSESLVGRRVGLLEIEEDRWRLTYRHQPLGILDARPDRIRIEPLGAAAPSGR